MGAVTLKWEESILRFQSWVGLEWIEGHLMRSQRRLQILHTSQI